jgi:hypothetical protein
MGHLQTKIAKDSQTSFHKNNKKSIKHFVHHFYVKPVYFNRNLIYVYFSPIKDSTYTKTLVYDNNIWSTYSVKILLLFVVIFYFIYVQHIYSIIDNTHANDYITSNLIQLDTDPVTNKSINQILDYRIL